MSHPVVAFAPAAEGKPSPAPWQPVKANAQVTSVDLVAELVVPHDPSFPKSHLNQASWIALLLRFITNQTVTITLVSRGDTSFLKDGTTVATLAEAVPMVEKRAVITPEIASWVRANWYESSAVGANDAVVFAVAALYHSHRASEPLGMVSVWAGLERIFSAKDAELKYRVCTNIAAFLEPPGETRYALFKRLTKLYDDRSRAAHGSPMKIPGAYQESAQLACRALLRIIELNLVPDKDSLERELLAPSPRQNKRP